MTLRVGINGFGRMGRLTLRAAWGSDLEFVRINDPAGDAATLAHLLNFDSIHRRWDRTASTDGEALIIEGRRLPINDSGNIAIYARAIKEYEKNKLEIKGNDIFINGIKTNSYTFKLDYYWMMGDNRHDSLDSRYWGFVPEDHIVGKALFVWWSFAKEGSGFNSIRWNRIFRGIN